MSIKDKTCIAGIGQTEWGTRRQFTDLTANDLIRIAFDRALEDAGLDRKDVDGFSTYGNNSDVGLTADLARSLGVPKVNYSNIVLGGGGAAAAASVGNAAAAVAAGYADVVMCWSSINSYVPPGGGAKARFASGWTRGADPWLDFQRPFGLVAPGQMFAMMFRRHMHLYGTSEDHLAEVAMAMRYHATRNPAAIMRTPMTREDYFNSRMIASPFRLFDFCLESVGAVVVLVTSAERARDLKQKPVYIIGAVQGGDSNWGRGMLTQNQTGDDLYASAGGKYLSERLYGQAGITAKDIDVAQFYDHFSGLVILQLEDWGFCKRGEGGAFVENGGLRFDTGKLAVNTSGGQLSEMYLTGIPHVVEATKQMRGTSTSQVKDAEIALVTSGPAPLPISGVLLRR